MKHSMNHKMRRSFDDVELGEDLGPLQISISRQTVVEYCRLWGFPMPNRFTDDDVARTDGMKFAVVPAPLSMAYMARLVSNWAAHARLKRLDIVLRGQLGHDQPVQVVGMVVDKDESGDTSEVYCDLYIQSADGVKLIGGQAVVELPPMPAQ